MLKFITHRPLWLNLITAVVLAVALFALFILSLNLLTHHGRSRPVPQVVGKTFAEAEKILDKEGFDIVIQDSVYIDSLPPLAIIKQVPESDAVVKVNRTVYLTLNRWLQLSQCHHESNKHWAIGRYNLQIGFRKELGFGTII